LEHPDLLGVCLSGAGPSLVGFAQKNVDKIAGLMRRTYLRTGNACTVRVLGVHQGEESLRTLLSVSRII
jgi:homoserine kinase